MLLRSLLRNVLRQDRSAAAPGDATYPSDATVATAHDTVTNFAQNANILSVRSGDWSDPGTWDLNRVPEAGDIVGIKTTHTVTYDVESDDAILAVGVAGTLAFATDLDTRLTVQNLLVYGPETLGGGYGVLRIGTAASPVQADKTAEIVFTDAALLDPNTGGTTNSEYSNGILCWGERTIHGAVKTPYVRTTGTVAASATTLNFASSQSGWTTSDRLLIPDTDQILDLSSHPPWKDEVRTPSDLTGTTATVAAMTYQHKCATDYLGAVDFTPHVANLSRNVIIRSESGDGVRGHCLTTGHARSDVRYCRFENLGRTLTSALPNTTTNQKGRYADHHHHVHYGTGGGAQGTGGLGYDAAVDPDEFDPESGSNTRSANGPTFRSIGNVYEDTSSDFDANKWPLTLHGTCDALVLHNVIYKASGSGYMHEDGNECFNVVDGNFVCRVSGDGDRGDASYSDGAPGREGNGFHWPNLRNYFRNNVACNVDGNLVSGPGVPFHGVGFHVYNGSAITLPNTATGEGPSQTIPAWQGAHASEDGITDTRWPALQFENNECYSTIFSFVSWFIGAYYSAIDEGIGESVFNLNTWHCRHSVFNFPGSKHRYLNCVWRGDWSANNGGNATCSGWGATDYLQGHLVLDGCDIQGFGVGIVCNEKSGSGDLSTDALVTDCLLVNYFNVYTATMNAVSGSLGLSARKYTFQDCTLVRAPLTLVSEGSTPRKHLYRGAWYTMFFTPSQNNWAQLDRMFFAGCTGDGAAVPDVQSFFHQQHAKGVMEQQWVSAGQIQIGGTARGRSNELNAATSIGRTTCGQIVPRQAYRLTHFDGYVCPSANGGIPARDKLRGRLRNLHTTTKGF